MTTATNPTRAERIESAARALLLVCLNDPDELAVIATRDGLKRALALPADPLDERIALWRTYDEERRAFVCASLRHLAEQNMKGNPTSLQAGAFEWAAHLLEAAAAPPAAEEPAR